MEQVSQLPNKEKSFQYPISVIVGSLLFIMIFAIPLFIQTEGLLSIVNSSEKSQDTRVSYCEQNPEYKKECLKNPSLSIKKEVKSLWLTSVIYVSFFIYFLIKVFENSKFFKKDEGILYNLAITLHTSIYLVIAWNWESFLMGSKSGFSFYEYLKYYIIPLL